MLVPICDPVVGVWGNSITALLHATACQSVLTFLADFQRVHCQPAPELCALSHACQNIFDNGDPWEGAVSRLDCHLG